MTGAPRITSRRRPRLRLVSPTLDTTRHASFVRLGDTTVVVDIWTFAEWDKLQEWERPDNPGIVPGLGFMVSSAPRAREIEDLADAGQQAWELHDLRRGNG